MKPVAALWILCRREGPSEHPEVQPIGVPVGSFDTKEAAETEMARLEHAARESASVGPSLQRLLPGRAADIASAAKVIGLPPLDLAAIGPEVKLIRTGNRITNPKEYSAYTTQLKQAVAEWWALVSAELTPAKNAALWDALFPNVNFYLVGRVLID